MTTKYPAQYLDDDWDLSAEDVYRNSMANSNNAAISPYDLPATEKTGDVATDAKKAQLRFQLQHSVNSGQISYEEGLEAMTQEDHGFVAKALEAVTPIEATDSKMQTFIDILSLDNYAMASYSAARLDAINAERRELGEDPGFFNPVRWNPLAFSSADVAKHMKDRTYFGDVYGVDYDFSTAAGWGAIATDILMSPTTFLTFGVGAGAKVAGKGITKSLSRLGLKEAAGEAGEVTLSRWGVRMQKEAAEELWPTVSKELTDKVNNEGLKLAAIAEREGFLERTVEYMLDPANYNRLAEKAWAKDKRIVSRAQRLMGDAVSEADELAVPTINRLFQETTPLHLKELGVPGAKLRRGLEGLDQSKWYGQMTYKTMKSFNPAWGLDENSRTLLSTMRDSIADQKRTWLRGIADEFGDLTDDEAFAVTNLLESADDLVNFSASNAAKHMGVQYSGRVLEKAARAKQIFDDIAVEEQKVGILNNTLDNYVTHMFNFDPRKVEQFMQVAREKGWSAGGNRFSRHRQVASISDLKGLFPEDQLVTNIGEILYRRKAMSIDLVNKQKFYTEMAAKSGYPSMLIAKAGESVPAAFAKRMMETRASAAELSDLRQYYQHQGFDAASWGFKEGDTNTNLNVLRWLGTERTARAADAAWVTDRLSNFTQTIKTKFKYSFDNIKQEVDALEAINGLLRNDPLDKMPWRQTKTAINKLDQELRKKGIGPLLGIMPELEQVLGRGLKNAKKPPKKYKEFIDGLKKPVKDLKLEAAIPEEMAIRAKAFRRQMGILTDGLKASSQVKSAIDESLTRFGFKPKETEKLLKTMFDKRNIDDLTKAEADGLETFLGLHSGSKEARKTYTNMIGEEMVEVQFRSPSGKIPSIISTNLDEIGKVSRKTAEQYSSQAVKIAAQLKDKGIVRTRLTQSLQGIEEYTKRLKAARSSRIGKKKGTEAYDTATREMRDLSQKISAIKKAEGNVTRIKSRLGALNAEITKLKKAEGKASLNVKISDLQKKLRDAADAHLRTPTSATKKALSDAEKKIRTAASKAGIKDVDDLLDHGVKTVPTARTPFVPRSSRFAEGSLVQGPRESVRFGQEGLEVARDPGLFGAQIGAVGERAFAIEAKSYYFPRSVADVIKEINTSVYAKETGWLLKRYDLIQNAWKAPLMAPWPNFYKRNSITNASLTYLKSGLAMLVPETQKDFLRAMVYVLNKEAVTVGNLPKTAAAFQAGFGGIAGGIVGGMQEAQEDDASLLGGLGSVLGGAIGGAAIGGAAGGVMGAGAKAALTSAGQAGAGALAPHALVGAAAGAGVAGEGERLKGAAIGAVAGGAFARKSLGKGWKNIEELEKMTIKVGNKSFTIKEFTEEAAARGVFSTHVSDEIFAQSGVKTAAMAERMGIQPKTMSAAMRPEQLLFARDMFRAGELASEIPSRLMLFTIEAKRTGSLGEAARAVKEYLYDYSNLSIFERRYIRRTIPFYTWVKHALSVSVDSFYKQPGRVGHMYKFVNNQNKHADVDPADYPDWLSTRLKRVNVVLNEETGQKEVEVKQGYGLVQEDMMDLWKQAFGGDPSKLITRGPFLATPALEYMMDKDFFRGTHIKSRLYERSGYESGKSFENAPDWMKKAVGFSIDPQTGYSKVDPRAAWMLSEIPASRFMNIARQVYDNQDKDYNWVGLARQVLGEKVYKYGPEQKLYHDKAKLDRMAMYLKNIGKLDTYKRYATADKQPAAGPNLPGFAKISGY